MPFMHCASLSSFPTSTFVLHFWILSYVNNINIPYILPYKGKCSSQKHLDLYARHISYQPKERCFRSSLTHNTIGFNPIRARVGIKSAHRCLLIHYQQLIFTKILFGSYKHAGLYVIILYSHGTFRCAVKQWINNACQLKLQSGVFVWVIAGTKWRHLCLLVLFNKLRLIFTKLLFGSHKHVGLYVIILDSHALSTTGTSRWLAII